MVVALRWSVQHHHKVGETANWQLGISLIHSKEGVAAAQGFLVE